jgi:intracellular septation protein
VREMNPWLKMALEIGPLVVFFGAFQWFKGAPVIIAGREYEGVVMATALFIPAILAALAVSWIKTRHLPRMSVVTAIVVVIFGGLTLVLNDDVFIKMKPTIVNALFAVGLGFGLLQRRSYLKYLMGDVLPLDDEGWMIFTRRWMLFFLFLAVLNEVIWRSTSTEFWVSFKTFGNMPLTFAFMAAQYPILKKHGLEDAR